MKALTLTQPWATLVASGVKKIENRPWSPPRKMIGQRFAIHASREVSVDAVKKIAELDPAASVRFSSIFDARGNLKENALPTMAIVGLATLHYVVTTPLEAAMVGAGQAKWFFGPIGLVLKDIVEVSPISIRGALGFWELPDEIVYKIAEIERA